METIENNKIIVEFMGLKPIEVFGSYSISKDHVSVNCKTEVEAFESFCKSTKYHSDWNWLMEVVEKIEEIQSPKGFRYAFEICGNSVNIGLGKTTNIFKRKTTKKESIYSACLEFIEWYNQQNN